LPAYDNIVLAYAGWTRVNAVVEQFYSAAATVVQTHRTRLVQGHYYALRVVWGNGGGGGNYGVDVEAPDS
jgi:hypothetical protein